MFDTGYSGHVFEASLRFRLYNWIVPITCGGQDGLIAQLSNDGIKPCDIKGIIVSHLHPDHIGGLLDFPDSKIYLSQKTYLTYQNPKLLGLIFMNLIPYDFENRIEILDFAEEYDLFKDGTLILHDVSGHTNGQMGMLLPEHNTFYAADSCWGMDLLDKRMKFLARSLQKDYNAYQKTIGKLRQMRAKGINIIVSHEVHI